MILMTLLKLPFTMLFLGGSALKSKEYASTWEQDQFRQELVVAE